MTYRRRFAQGRRAGFVRLVLFAALAVACLLVANLIVVAPHGHWQLAVIALVLLCAFLALVALWPVGAVVPPEAPRPEVPRPRPQSEVETEEEGQGPPHFPRVRRHG